MSSPSIWGSSSTRASIHICTCLGISGDWNKWVVYSTCERKGVKERECAKKIVRKTCLNMQIIVWAASACVFVSVISVCGVNGNHHQVRFFFLLNLQIMILMCSVNPEHSTSVSGICCFIHPVYMLRNYFFFTFCYKCRCCSYPSNDEAWEDHRKQYQQISPQFPRHWTDATWKQNTFILFIIIVLPLSLLINFNLYR